MEELARLMDELCLALRARTEAGKRTESLAREVQALPKLSVLANALRSDPAEESQEDVLERVQLQLELQSLRHTKQEALKALNAALHGVNLTRRAITRYHHDKSNFLEDITQYWREEEMKPRIIICEQMKRDLIEKMKLRLVQLEKLAAKAETLSS